MMLTYFVLASLFVSPPQSSDAVIGAVAIDLDSGTKIAIRGDERFPMGSVYKFPIGIAVLRLIDAGTLSLDQPVTIEPPEFAPNWSPLRDKAAGKAVTRSVGELLDLTVAMSDNTASDALLRLAGGPAAVTAVMVELEQPAIRIDRSEKQMDADLRQPRGVEKYAVDPRDTATPAAIADLLVAFRDERLGLSAESQTLLWDLMAKSPTGARKLRAGVPDGWSVVHKSGMMPGTSNDVGILTSPDGGRQIAIAIFAKGATSPYEQIDADIAALTRAIVEQLTE